MMATVTTKEYKSVIHMNRKKEARGIIKRIRRGKRIK